MRRTPFVFLLLLLLCSAAAEATVTTCPNSWPWVKRDNLSGKSYTYTPPSGYRVTDTCYKAGTSTIYGTVEADCDESVTVTTSGQNELSHASFKLAACPTPTPTPPPPTPTATPTPPPTPTPTPTPPSTPTPTPTPTPCIEEQEPICSEATCGLTLEWKSNCNTLTKTCEPCPCVPITECGSRCGNISDNCGGTLYCGTCPPPPPPPGRWPDPVCDYCQFPYTLSIENKRIPNEWHAEWFYFMKENVITQIVLDMYDNNEYTIYSGAQEPNTEGNKKYMKLTGGRTVTIPWPNAGLPMQQWTHLGFTGGAGRMTIWLRDPNFVIIKSDTLKVVVSP